MLIKFLEGHWQLILITVIVFMLWGTPVAYPLKILVVFMHELSHGLAAVFTVGSIEAISLSVQEGGHAITRGGSRFIILSADYVGSLVFGLWCRAAYCGAANECGSCGSRTFRVGDVTCDGPLYPRPFSVDLLYDHWLFNAGKRTGPEPSNQRLCVTCHWVYQRYLRAFDIFSDTIARSNLRSDAYMLAVEFGGPTMFWGGLWLILSLIVIGFWLRFALRQRSNL